MRKAAKLMVSMEDKYQRKINYARISLTDRCNLRCRYCMPPDGVAKKLCQQIISLEQVKELCIALADLGISKIRFTGGEPLLRKGVAYFIADICRLGLFKQVALTSNGLLLSEYGSLLKQAGLNTVNLSLDSLNPELYHKLTHGGDLKQALQGLDTALSLGFDKIKINAVLTDLHSEQDLAALLQLTVDYDLDMRFIELMPMGQCASWAEEHFCAATKIKQLFPELRAVINPDPHSPAVLYQLPNGRGKVGLITPLSCAFCANCNRLRFTADGMIKPCLHSDRELDIKASFGCKEQLKAKICQAIMLKPKEHQLNQKNYIKREMKNIGG